MITGVRASAGPWQLPLCCRQEVASRLHFRRKQEGNKPGPPGEQKWLSSGKSPAQTGTFWPPRRWPETRACRWGSSRETAPTVQPRSAGLDRGSRPGRCTAAQAPGVRGQTGTFQRAAPRASVLCPHHKLAARLQTGSHFSFVCTTNKTLRKPAPCVDPM